MKKTLITTLITLSTIGIVQADMIGPSQMETGMILGVAITIFGAFAIGAFLIIKRIIKKVKE